MTSKGFWRVGARALDAGRGGKLGVAGGASQMVQLRPCHVSISGYVDSHVHSRQPVVVLVQSPARRRNSLPPALTPQPPPVIRCICTASTPHQAFSIGKMLARKCHLRSTDSSLNALTHTFRQWILSYLSHSAERWLQAFLMCQ